MIYQRSVKISLVMFHQLIITGPPITISPVISKIFEYCLLFQFEGAVDSSHLQFGFKNNSSCSHAIFLLKEVTDYFVSRGSNVYMAGFPGYQKSF